MRIQIQTDVPYRTPYASKHNIVICSFPPNVSSVSINICFFVRYHVVTNVLAGLNGGTFTNRTHMVFFSIRNILKGLEGTEHRKVPVDATYRKQYYILFVINYWGAQQPYFCDEFLRPISWMIRCRDCKHILTHETGLYGSS
jgi:hypothetical protein